MRGFRRPALGLIGRIFAILLVAVLIEFGTSTFFYERESQLSVRDDEARRLAEHLIIARKLLAEQPPARRERLARDLTTSRYDIAWSAALPPARRMPATLDRVHRQVIAWEPSLGGADLRLRLSGPGRQAMVAGSLRLGDGSFMQFASRVPLHHLGVAWERMLLALGPSVVVILICGLLLRQMLLPLRRLADAAERVGRDDVSEVAEGGPGEVRRVIGAFNRMQARIHRLIADRTQALAAVGHDLRTPLARLRLRADMVAEDDTRDALETDLVEMEAMIASLLAYLGGDGDAEQPGRVDLAVLCQTLVDDAADRGREADYRGPDHLEAIVRPSGFKRALVNLVENALHYATRVTLSVEDRETEVAVHVADDGPGIPEESLDMVLEPFVRLDRARSRDTVGLGLGLSIVQRAVEAEGGRLMLANRRTGGLRATILLPSNKS